MKVALRFDCTPGLGTGHVHRMANLAEELSRIGAEIIYITSSMTIRDDLPARIDGFLVETNHISQTNDWDLTINPQTIGNTDTRFEELDALSTLGICNRRKIDLLILDHYFLNQNWANILSKNGIPVVAIDDLGRDWDNLFSLIDYSPMIKTKYQNCPGIEHKLFGLQYALLSKDYREIQRSPQDEVERIQIFTGGADATGLTNRLMKIVRPMINHEEKILLVIGDQNSDSSILHEQWANDERVEIYTGLKTLSGINSISNWSIGAGGVAAIERCCAGVPSLVVSITENQELISEELSSLGAITYLGSHNHISDSDLRTAIESFKVDRKSREEMSKVAQERVDPFGVQRVLISLLPDLQNMKIRSVNFSDSEKLYSWVNDPLVRKNSLNSNFVTRSEHQLWFRNYLDSARSQMYILEIGDLSIGQVRFDLRDDSWHIDYSIDSKFRGLGLGKRIIKMGLKEMNSRPVKKYVAEVRDFNKTSQRIFESIGFTLDRSNEDQVIKYISQPEKE